MAAGLKRKFNQNDLRRLMSEQKAKSAPKTTTTTINSPLAKYNDLGQLMCVLCRSVVRSEDVWKVHINAKQHKQNVELAKKSSEKLASLSTASTASKRMAPPPTPEVPAKIPKSILKNSSKPPNPSSFVAEAKPTPSQESALPENFFDASTNSGGNFFEATLTKTSIKTNLINIKRNPNDAEKSDESTNEANSDLHKDETLPEGFFDDPIKDAKARKSEYKDPVEEEWERFQQEIKAESDFSNAIIAEDQEEAITERQIDEIDEQIRNWNRVLELEKKKENVNAKAKGSVQIPSKPPKRAIRKQKVINNDSDTSEDEIGDIDEYLDWRSKKAYK